MVVPLAVPVREFKKSFAFLNKVPVFFAMIKFEHTVFALPFAYLGSFLARDGVPPLADLFWITMAMVGARTSAMSLNRLIDCHLDALNPRTANRALPRGQLSSAEVMVYVLASLLLLGFSAWQLNILCVQLMPAAVFLLVIYSYTKRWTWACHLILGATDGLAPLGGWVAITGSIDFPGVLLWLAVTFWVAGFDVIYGCQDIEFDRSFGLKSIPACFGLERALLVSRFFQLIAFLLFTGVGWCLKTGVFYWMGLLSAGVLLVWQQRLVSRDLSRLEVAFFVLNAYFSLLISGFGLLDVFLSRLP
jgi:4-hydroxybenzoate polyprenyltransferase